MNKNKPSWWQRLRGAQSSEDSSRDKSSVARSKHSISRKCISPNALKVLYRLQQAHYEAYLVGGGVRDLLLGRQSKDFDIATNASPEQIRRLFRNSRVIGRRFRLVHVFFTQEIIEVSTFRAALVITDDGEGDEDLPLNISDNIFGTIEEDTWRRDFTVNALYYNIEDGSIVDYTGGLEDFDQRLLRVIGDPKPRFHEDPVRLLRAIRFAAKLEFSMEPETEAAVFELGYLLKHVSSSRLFHEFDKLFYNGYAQVTYEKLVHYGYFSLLFPGVDRALRRRQKPIDECLVIAALQSTDQRQRDGQSLNPAFLLSVLLWSALQLALSDAEIKGGSFFSRFMAAKEAVLQQQSDLLRIPRRQVAMMKSIWLLQYYLEQCRPSRVKRTVEHRYFRAAYDLLVLRDQSGEALAEIVAFWQPHYKKGTKSRQREGRRVMAKRKRTRKRKRRKDD